MKNAQFPVVVWSAFCLFIFWPLPGFPGLSRLAAISNGRFYKTPTPAHQEFDLLLKKYVNPLGKVNYSGFLNDVSALNRYIKNLADSTPTDAWTRNEKMAYWVNLYNALTIQLICTRYPVSSIREIDGGKCRDAKRVVLKGENYSLNRIEQKELSLFQDPKLFLAANCAAQSCPPLMNAAWTAENIEERLELQTRQFINNPAYNKISGRNLHLSYIFKIHENDFGNLSAFISKYTFKKVPPNAQIDYFEFDWRLNEAL